MSINEPSKSFTAEEFRSTCGLWATGVSIVTTISAAGDPYGLTMNGVTSLSLEPPMMLVCVDLNSDTLAPMTESGCFCINVLTKEQEQLSNRFAKKGTNKFESVTWNKATTGAPVIVESLVSIDCSVNEIYDGGDHKIFCGEALSIVPTSETKAPLIYFSGRYKELIET